MALNKMQFKKGVALITVLLFMMMATIGATAVYKWLSSENKASAARLKQSEAFQASQAGINAARAWLAFNGNETGAIVTQFVNDRAKTPISLNSMLTPMNSALQQNFSVTLTDVDASSSPVKVKIISTGMGRDNSRYSQVAILTIEGLYKVSLPNEVATTAYEYAYFGGSINYAAEHHATSMVINGNWTGNPGVVGKDFIVTGNAQLSGSHINIGGTGCIGGEMNADNGLDAGDIYIAGDALGMLRTIDGQAYFDGNVSVTSDLNIAGNVTVNKGFKVDPQGHETTIQGNLCVGDNGYVNFASEGSGHRFSVLGNVWMPNSGSLSGQMSKEMDEYKTFGAKNSSEIYMAGTYQDSVKECTTQPGQTCYYYHQEGDFFSELYGMITGQYNWRYFTTQAQYRSSATAGFTSIPFACGSEVKEYCDTKWEKKPGCNGAQYMVKDMLTTAYENFEKKANKVSCAANIVGFENNESEEIVKSLNTCYETAVANEDPNLYNGYLVVKFHANQNATPKGVLKGKFIIIYDENAGTLRLPPSEGITMVYLKNGSGDILQTVGSAKYNYFFYTKKDIAQLLEGSSPWSGSVYAEAASCAKVGNVQGTVDLEYNADVLNDLIKAKAICDASESACGEEDDEESGSGSEGTSGDASRTVDAHWIALSPTLKISLASQYANEELIRNDADELNPSLLVMPRIIYLTVDERLKVDDDRNYNVVYLGGLEPSGSGSADCYPGSHYNSGTRIDESSPFEEIGLHSCRYTEGSYSSDFWVWVSDKDRSSKVAFDISQYKLGDACEEEGIKKKSVFLTLTSGSKIMPGTLNIYVYNSSSGSSLTPKSSELFELSEPTSLNGYDVYKLTITKDNLTTIPDPLFDVEIQGGCAAATGFVQFQLEDANFNDGLTLGIPNNEVILFGEGSGQIFHLPIEDDQNASDDIKNRPDCSVLENLAATWGAFYGTNANNGCEQVSESFDAYSGPWLCPLGSFVKMKPADEAIWSEECELWQVSDAIVENVANTVVYASLKKKQFVLHVEIEGLQGEADAYSTPSLPNLNDKSAEELESDAEVSVYTPDDVLMGTCKSGNKGTCDFKVYYGQHYYVRAKGKYFDHWTYECSSGLNNCGTSTGSANSRVIAVTTKEDVTVQANYTKTGYCFNEDFTHLHPYCDYEVTPWAIGGLTAGRAKDKVAKYYRKTETETSQFPQEYSRRISDALMKDAAHGNGEYCIDQCVTNREYRFSELGSAFGTNYEYYYDYYCSVEGKTVDGSIDKKEAEVWSYYDPGIPCKQMVERAYEDWKMPWTTRFGITKEDALKNCSDNPDDFSYRCVSGAGNKGGATTLNCTGKHPKSLTAPRVYGGYYPQNDPWSPWIKVISVNLSQQTKLGSRRSNGESYEIVDENNVVKKVRESIWNIKPYIFRGDDSDKDNPLPAFMSMHGSGVKTSFIILRKEKAGYNGTYTKTFTWNGSGESNDGGSVSSIVFRSNADASSYFLIAINPSADVNDATQQHFTLCHATERQSFSENAIFANGEESSHAREMLNPLNTGHCIKEDLLANLPWANIKERTLQLTVALENQFAKITFAYSNDKTSVGGTDREQFTGPNSTIYIQKSFNLEDPSLFGYPIDNWSERIPKVDAEGNSTHIYRDPITEMKNHPEDYGYVGFIVHNENEKIYNLNWRSGGSCGGAYRENARVYCGYEETEQEAGSHAVPVRYMYDFCPDGGECKCDYEYTTDNGKFWYKENEFTLPKEPRKYPYGTLKVKAHCKDQNSSKDTTIIENCNGFTTYDPNSDGVCYDNYELFEKYNNALTYGNITLYNSRIAGIDNNYSSKIGTYAGSEGDKLRQKFCVDTEDLLDPRVFDRVGLSHYRFNGYCSNYATTEGDKHNLNTEITIDGVKFKIHPRESGVNFDKNSNLPTDKYLMVGNGSRADSYEGTITNYLQLTDIIDNTNNKGYLNLKGADLIFSIYQNNLVDDIRVFLEDADGNRSESFSIDEIIEDESEEFNNIGSIQRTLNNNGDYCDINDNRISEAQYNALNLDEKENYYQEFCQVNLVWVRDLKRFARKEKWNKLYPYRKVRANVTKKFKGTTNFDDKRVSRIYFEVDNDRGGGIHISQLRADCPTSLEVTDCRINSEREPTPATSRTFIEGVSMNFMAKTPGASQCKLKLSQHSDKLTYADIKGPEFTEANGLETPWFSCGSIVEKGPITLTCENSSTDYCEARLTLVAKNTSDEEASCVDANRKAQTMYIKVENTKYTCYGYNFDYTMPTINDGQPAPAIVEQSYNSGQVMSVFNAGDVEYNGSGTISMGIDFNKYPGYTFEAKIPNPQPYIKLRAPDGKLIQEIKITDNPSTAVARIERCAQRQTGTIYKINKKDGITLKEYKNHTGYCAFFQFNPEEYGSGEYLLSIGNADVPACKINVDVPLAKIIEGSCAITPGTAVAKGATIQVSATGANLIGTGSVKIGGTEHECSFDEANSVISCSGITAPTEKGTYDVELSYNGRKTTCPSLTVADKPTVKSCDVLDGKFVAKVDNPASVTYNYRLIRCANLLGMGCTIETEGREVETYTSNAISIGLPKHMTSIQDGKDYTYVFQVSTSSDFPEDNVSYCPANPSNSREDGFREERGNRDMTLECGFTTATAPKEGNVTFYVKNAHGFKSEKTMSLVTSGGTDLGSVTVKSDGSTTEQKLTVPTSLTVGEKYEVELHDDGKSVCKAEVSIAPVTALCSFSSGASDAKKGAEYYEGFEVYDVHGLASSQYMTLKYGDVGINTSCNVSADPSKTSKCNVKIPATAKSGSQKFTLVYDGRTVCEASTNVLPIKTDCQIIKNESNEAVNKVIATTNVKMQMSNFQNVGGAVNAKFKCDGGDYTSISFDQNTSYQTSIAYGVPDLTGSVTYNVYDESGEGICTTPPTVNVVKPSVECKVANDDSRSPGNTTTIMNSNHTPNTHFYFYVKYTGNPTTSFVVTSPWNRYATEYDVQDDDHSYYSKDCGSHNASGYSCVTVYPSHNTSGGFTAQASPYHYIYYVDYSDYYNGTYSGTKLECQRDVYIR